MEPPFLSALSKQYRLAMVLAAPLLDRDLTAAISPPPFGKSFTLDVLGEQGCLLGIGECGTAGWIRRLKAL